jgi:hypothetical protein
MEADKAAWQEYIARADTGPVDIPDVVRSWMQSKTRSPKKRNRLNPRREL